MSQSSKSYQSYNFALTVVSAATPVALLAYHLAKNRKAQSQAKEGQIVRPQKWFRGAFNTPFSSALTLDLSWSTLVFLCFAKHEVDAGRVKGPFWLYAFLNIFVGLSPAFPLLLLRRNLDQSRT